jgi:hypothetical protein
MKKQKVELKPCPFCGGTDLSLDWKTHQGHGDRTFSALRVICGCGATNGLSGYSEPNYDQKMMVQILWNRRVK